jgi:hypothetical protein
MGIKAFALGAAVVYGVQHITKKREDGSTILSDFMEDPKSVFKQPKPVEPEEVYIVTVPVNNEQAF